MRKQKGMTVVEILVALLIVSILTTAGFALYLRTHQTYVVQQEVTDTQFRVRDALRQVTKDIQMAGFLLPTSIAPFVAYNTNPDSITISSVGFPACQGTLSQAMAQPTEQLTCNGQNLTCFQVNQWHYIYDPNTKTGEFFMVNSVNTGTFTIQHNTALSKSYPLGSQVLKMDVTRFSIDKATDPNHPRLMVSYNFAAPIIYANDISDLQLLYTLADGTVTSTLANSRLVREVKITVTGQTQRADVDWNNLRRLRTMTTTVKIRNLDL